MEMPQRSARGIRIETCLTVVGRSMLQTSEEDVSQFDTKFTKQTPVDSPDDSLLSESANQIFMVSHVTWW